MSFTLTEDPQFYGLEMSLSNILIISLFRSNNILKQKKTRTVKHVRDHTFMMPAWKGGGGVVGGFLRFVTCFQIYRSFLWIMGVGRVTKLVIFCGPLNGLKLRPIPLLEAVVSSSTSGQMIHFD